MTIIATARVPRQFRIDDASTITLPQPCPTWCDQTCQNPDAGTGSTTMHGNEVAVITDTVNGDTSKVAVSLQRLDINGKPGQATVIIETLKGPGDLGPAAIAALIDALTRANAVVIADRADNSR